MYNIVNVSELLVSELGKILAFTNKIGISTMYNIQTKTYTDYR